MDGEGYWEKYDMKYLHTSGIRWWVRCPITRHPSTDGLFPSKAKGQGWVEPDGEPHAAALGYTAAELKGMKLFETVMETFGYPELLPAGSLSQMGRK